MGGTWTNAALAAAFALLAALSGPVAIAQPRTTTPRAMVSYDDVRFQRYSVGDGLSQPTVKAMVQDAAGYVWLGTQDGLNRFDGYQFRVYRNRTDDPASLPDNNIQTLMPARRGGFWVATRGGGLARYLPGQDRFERHSADGRPGSLASNELSTIREDAKGRLWVAGSAGQLQWLAPAGDRFTTIPSSVTQVLGQVLTIEPYGRDFLIGSRRGLFLMTHDGTRASVWGDGSVEDVEAIEVDPLGRGVWVGSDGGGVTLFDDHGRVQRRWGIAEGMSDQIRDLVVDGGGRLWVAMFHGLARLDSVETAVRSWRFGDGLSGAVSSSNVFRLMLDRDGLLWAGTWMNGVNVYVPETRKFGEVQVRDLSTRNPSAVSIHALMVDRDQTLWLAAGEGMSLLHCDIRGGLIAQYLHDPAVPGSLPDARVTHMLRDRDGRVWAATGRGPARLDNGRFTLFPIVDEDGRARGTSAHRLYQDHDGTIWAATRDGALAALCPGCNRFRVYRLTGNRSEDPRNGNVAEAMFEDSRGNFWVGGRVGGLLRLDRASGRIERFSAGNGTPGRLRHNTITAIVEDRRGRLWLGTQGGGVNRLGFDSKGRPVFTAYGMREGLATEAVGGIVEDDEGMLWVSTSAGVSRLNPDTGQIVNFGSSAGTQETGYFVASYGRLDDGRILFSGMHGVTVFDAREVEPLPPPHRVELTELRLLRMEGLTGPSDETSRRDASGALILPPEGDDISLAFSALSYVAPRELLYAYRLDGVNERWVEVDAHRRVASYNNLAPGRYTFRARARYPDGSWGDELSIPIVLEAPWWRTAWARGALALLAALAVIVVAWQMRQRWTERDQARRRIADSEERLKLALWGTGDELWDLDVKRREVRRLNPLDQPELGGQELVEQLGSMRDSVHPEDLARFDAAVETHLAGNADVLDLSYRVLDADGQWRWIRSRGRVTARDEQHTPLRITGTHSDITKIKQGEQALERINLELESRVRLRTDALHETNESLRNTIDELRLAQNQLVEAEKMAALGSLVEGVAHDLHTPLGIGVTAASNLELQARKLGELIKSGRVDSVVLEQFRRTTGENSQLILRNLMSADRMVRSFKQVAVDQSSETPRRIELGAYLEDVLVSLKPSLRQGGHSVSVECPQPITFETYPGAIYQIVSNLVLNSVMHGFEDRANGHIRLHARVVDDQVLLDYRDDGAGMPPEVRRHAFEPFFTTRRGKGGSGLGLHIVWNLATQMLGGSIDCESTPGEGTCFHLRIPCRLPVKSPPPRA